MTEDLDPTPAEQKLIEAAAKGEIADYRVGDKEADDPANGGNWGAGRTLRAEIIYALCTDTGPDWKVHAKGVWAWGAHIVGELDFDAATLSVPLGLVHCLIDQPIIFVDARARILNFSGSLCNGIKADRLKVDGAFILSNGFSAKGEVRLLGANIGGNLECSGAKFENPGGIALAADGLVTKGSVFFNGDFSAEGEVRLLGADIGGNLECFGAKFKNPDGKALSADGLITKGAVFLRDGFSTTGEVRLIGANIGGYLDCTKAKFENPEGNALLADRMVTKGNVFLHDGFSAKGEVRLLGADIGGDLSCIGAKFENPGGYALTAENMRVNGILFWHGLTPQPKGVVNFAHARVGQLADDEKSWPIPGNLILDGFVYGSFAGNAPKTAAERLRWLRLQPEEPAIRRQPYEQLVKVLRQMGHDKDARDIAIAKQEAIRKSAETGKLLSAWMWFLKATIGYGYKPWRALICMAFICALGTIVFDFADIQNVMVPTQAQGKDAVPYQKCEKPYPCLQPFVYSVDAFLPIVDLHQEKYWLPDTSKTHGWFYSIYLWLHIMSGWLLTSVLIAGLTNLVKKD